MGGYAGPPSPPPCKHNACMMVWPCRFFCAAPSQHRGTHSFNSPSSGTGRVFFRLIRVFLLRRRSPGTHSLTSTLGGGSTHIYMSFREEQCGTAQQTKVDTARPKRRALFFFAVLSRARDSLIHNPPWPTAEQKTSRPIYTKPAGDCTPEKNTERERGGAFLFFAVPPRARDSLTHFCPLGFTIHRDQLQSTKKKLGLTPIYTKPAGDRTAIKQRFRGIGMHVRVHDAQILSSCHMPFHLMHRNPWNWPDHMYRQPPHMLQSRRHDVSSARWTCDYGLGFRV